MDRKTTKEGPRPASASEKKEQATGCSPASQVAKRYQSPSKSHQSHSLTETLRTLLPNSPSLTVPPRETRDLLRLGVRLACTGEKTINFPVRHRLNTIQQRSNSSTRKKKQLITPYTRRRRPLHHARPVLQPYLPYRTVLDFANFLLLGTRHLVFSFLILSSLSSLQLAFPVILLSVPPIIDSSVSACPSISGFAVVSHESRTILQSAWLNSPCFDYYPSVA